MIYYVNVLYWTVADELDDDDRCHFNIYGYECIQWMEMMKYSVLAVIQWINEIESILCRFSVGFGTRDHRIYQIY